MEAHRSGCHTAPGISRWRFSTGMASAYSPWNIYSRPR